MIELCNCLVCGEVFTSLQEKGQHLRYSHDLSIERYYNEVEKKFCKGCGKQIAYRPMFHSVQYCGRSCSSKHNQAQRFHALGEDSHSWKGGRVTTPRGYVYVNLDLYDDEYVAILEPMATKSTRAKYVFEHRAVMAIYLGRSLRREEIVHHRNGNPGDNRLENLELWVKGHPSGVRVAEAG